MLNKFICIENSDIICIIQNGGHFFDKKYLILHDIMHKFQLSYSIDTVFSFLMSVHTLTDKCKPKYLQFSKWTPNCVPYNGRFQNSIFFNVYQAVAASVYIILLSRKEKNDSLG